MDCRSGDNPPCIQRILSSISAATGRQLKQSVKVFQSLMLYRRRPTFNRWITLIIEAVYAIDAGTLVVAPQQEEVLRVLNFVSQQ